MKRLLLVVALASACMAQGRLGGAGRVSGSGRLGAGSSGSSTTSRLFNGSSDYMTNSACYLQGATSFTVSFWFKSADTAQVQRFVMTNYYGGPRWAIIYGYTTSGGLDQIEFFTQGVVGGGDFRVGSQITIPDTNWHHIAYRYDGTEWAYFLDGVKTVINASFGGNNFSTDPCDAPFTLGATQALSAFVNGYVARLYISTSALTDMQIATMAGPTCSTSGVSGTVGYWLLGQASPDPEHSPSPNTNSFTVSGATISTGPSCSGT